MLMTGITKDAELYQKIKACSGKRAYNTEAEATEDIPTQQTVYQCDYCKLYHRCKKLEYRVLPRVKKEAPQPTITSRLRSSAATHYPNLVLNAKVIKYIKRQIQNNGARFLGRDTNTKSVFRVRYEDSDYVVLYSGSKKCIEEFLEAN